MGDEPADKPELPWSESFAVGITQLDAEHRALVAQINEICRHSYDGRKAEALQALDALLTLAASHFAHEEDVLRGLNGYAEIDTHAGGRRDRMKEVTALRQRFADAPADDVRLREALIDWFVRQSVGHDAAIKAFFDDGGTRFAGRPAPRKAS